MRLNQMLFGTTAAAFSLMIVSAQQQNQPPPVQQPPPIGQQAPSQQGNVQRQMQELQGAQNELQRIHTVLSQIQAKAVEQPEVKKKFKSLEKTFFKTMTDKAPEMEEEIDHLQKLTDNLRADEELNVPQQERSDEFNSRMEEYQKLKQQLMPIEQQTLRDPKISELNAEYQETVISTMEELNPKAGELLEQRSELVARVQSLQQVIQQQQTPQQRPPQLPGAQQKQGQPPQPPQQERPQQPQQP